MLISRIDARRARWVGPLAALALVILAAGPARSETIFAPDQSGDAPSGDAVAPSAGGTWDAFGATSSQSGLTRLPQAVRIACAGGDAVSLTRTTDFSPAPTTVLCTFNLSVSGGSAPSSQVLRLGAGFSASNIDETDARTFGRLGITVSGSGGTFRLRDLVAGKSSESFSGTQAITWALNRSGGTLQYAGPDGGSESIANDRMDVWVGRTKVFDDMVVTNAAVPMTNLKWFWNAGAGTTTLGMLQLAPLPAPESKAAQEAVTALAAAAPAEASLPLAPGALELYRPTPNPFQRTMRFAYEVPAGAARVDLGVYDVSGRRVKVLVSGAQSAGHYEVAWDGHADDGARARAGVYFLRAAIGTTQRVVRVVYLMK